MTSVDSAVTWVAATSFVDLTKTTERRDEATATAAAGWLWGVRELWKWMAVSARPFFLSSDDVTHTCSSLVYYVSPFPPFISFCAQVFRHWYIDWAEKGTNNDRVRNQKGSYQRRIEKERPSMGRMQFNKTSHFSRQAKSRNKENHRHHHSTPMDFFFYSCLPITYFSLINLFDLKRNLIFSIRSKLQFCYALRRGCCKSGIPTETDVG